MAHTKRRVRQHVMEEESISILKDCLPKEWVIHEYRPDYGVDNVIEIFRPVKDQEKKYDTLGDLFFVQLKSIESKKIDKIKVFARYNVEKQPLVSVKKEDEFTEIDVIKYNIEVDELLTVQAMGTGIPVLLILVTLDTKQAFFICLNDLIDKVILPEDPSFAAKDNKTIYIPIKNEVKNIDRSLVPLRFYAKRSKLYSAFIKFHYQFNELHYGNISTIKHFIKVLKNFDIWDDCEMWALIPAYFKELCDLEKQIYKSSEANYISDDKWILCDDEIMVDDNISDEEIKKEHDKYLDSITFKTDMLWLRLSKLSNVYEELCREWFLPTYLAQSISY